MLCDLDLIVFVSSDHRSMVCNTCMIKIDIMGRILLIFRFDMIDFTFQYIGSCHIVSDNSFPDSIS